MAMYETDLSSMMEVVMRRLKDKMQLLLDSELVRSIESEPMKDALEKLSRALLQMKALVVMDHEEDMRMGDPVFNEWLEKVLDAALNAEDVIESLSTKVHDKHTKQEHLLQQQFDASCLRIKSMAADIDSISQQMLIRHERAGKKQKPLHRTSFLSSQSRHVVVGRDEDKRRVLDMLLNRHSDHLSVVPIVGMAGLGKTTLAQSIFNSHKAVQHFDLRIWVSVSFDFNLHRILSDIISSITQEEKNSGGDSCPSILESRAVKLLAGKRFLIVLDDVWTEDYFQWEPLEQVFRHGKSGSRVLVTTRSFKVSEIMSDQHPYHMGLLSQHASWMLFKRIAFKDGSKQKLSDRTREDLEKIGKKIVAKCGGVPSAVKAAAGLLHGSTDSNKWLKISRSSICNAQGQNLLTALKLSYDHLTSPHIKQCFLYCSLFPQDHVFDKKELIQLWMAQGLIQSGEQERPEETGSQYFEELQARCFFQASDEGRDGYKMHHLLHELAVILSGSLFSQVKTSDRCSPSQRTRHVSVLVGESDVEQLVTEIVRKSKQLRTLVFPSQHTKNFGNSLDKIFQSSKWLRVLDLSSSSLSVLPESIGNLELLRSLDLSRTEVASLPNSLCSLYHLQTLRLVECLSLAQLPNDLANLINLRHLHLDRDFWYACPKLPPRMGSLSRLHNLHVFPIGKEKGYGIQELESLIHLTGTLHLSNLENAATTDAAKARMEEKENLEKLILEWSEGEEVTSDEAAVVLQHLRPHSNLQQLKICNLGGSRLPVWMTDGWLENLSTLSLEGCKIHEVTIHQLPRLQKLCLKGMKELQDLITGPDTEQSLEKLQIVDCPKLTKLSSSSSFAKLRKIKIRQCDSLEVLPETTESLTSLVLADNPALRDWNEVSPSSFSNLEELKVDGCPSLCGLPKHAAPKKLEINRCELVKGLPNPKCFRNLQHLAVDGACEGAELVRAIPDNSPLSSLVISNAATKSTSLPKWPHLPRLQVLHIRHCEALESLCDEAAGFQGLTFLKLLSIQRCPKLMKMPHDGLPRTLECFTISRCSSLESLGPKDVLRSLTSLSDLYIQDCPKLSSLPEEGVSSSLQHLVIQGCPLLVRRCRSQGDAPDWRKIMHVPDLELDSIIVSSPTRRLPPTPRQSSSSRWSILSCCRGLRNLKEKRKGRKLKRPTSLASKRWVSCPSRPTKNRRVHGPKNRA